MAAILARYVQAGVAGVGARPLCADTKTSGIARFLASRVLRFASMPPTARMAIGRHIALAAHFRQQVSHRAQSTFGGSRRRQRDHENRPG